MQSGSVTDNFAPLPNSSIASQAADSQHGSSPSVFGGSSAPNGSDGGGSVGVGGGGDSGGAPDSVPNGEHTSRLDKANRIARYEAANAVQFIVTGTDWTGKSSSPISRFPNEVLIHILSFLEPSALLSASLISKRFYSAANSPDAWRAAFVRFFPSPHEQLDDCGSPAALASQDKRYFTRLPTTESDANPWRKEYIRRTQLLRSLGRGKLRGPYLSQQNSECFVVTYRSWTGPLGVSHMAAEFSKDGVWAVHASRETQVVTESDSPRGMVIKRHRVVTISSRRQEHHHSGHEIAAEVNLNHLMDLSPWAGCILGETASDGGCYLQLFDSFFTRDRSPAIRNDVSIPPGNHGYKPLVTCVWIAKRESGGVRDSTRAFVMVGNSRGYIRIFSMDINKRKPSRNDIFGDHRREQIGAYCVSPGIPIVQIKVDEDYSPRTVEQLRRPWVAVINALGEIYYLCKKPKSSSIDDWKIIPPTVRTATPLHDGFFSALGKDLLNQPEERARLLSEMEYSTIKCLWEEFRMDWFLEVDWAGGNFLAGKSGSKSNLDGALMQKAGAVLMRYQRRQAKATKPKSFVCSIRSGNSEKQPLFGGYLGGSGGITPSPELAGDGTESPDLTDSWIATEMRIPDKVFARITAHSMDNSPAAKIDPTGDGSQQEGVPGGSARLFAVGTDTGSIFVFNFRSTATVCPIRIIHTNSPQVTALAVSSLIVVHGGDDGLVQAWDPLGSTRAPVRTLHSRFSAKARRRLEQNASNPIDDNRFAARCLVLDPDPTILRGVVALGTFIRYWSLSATDPNPGNRVKKIGGSGGRHGKSSQSNNRKSGVRETITGDSLAVQEEREQEEQAAEELEKRYGITSGRAALSEEDMLTYASMISQETFEQESSNRNEFASSLSGRSPETTAPEGSMGNLTHGGDDDLQYALRLSLQGVEANAMETQGPADNELCEDTLPFTESAVVAGPSNRSHTRLPSQLSASSLKKGGRVKVPIGELDQWSAPAAREGDEFDDELERAIRLSLQEHEQAQREGEGKGKGKGRA